MAITIPNWTMRSWATTFHWALWYRRRISVKVIKKWTCFYHIIINQIIVLEEQCLDEQLPKGIGAEDELKALRRRLRETTHAPPVKILLRRIIMKKPFSLECVRSLNEKEALLDEAIQCGNGDAILTVIEFLRKSFLNPFHFARYLRLCYLLSEH